MTHYCAFCETEAIVAIKRKDGHTSYLCATCKEAYDYGCYMEANQMEDEVIYEQWWEDER